MKTDAIDTLKDGHLKNGSGTSIINKLVNVIAFLTVLSLLATIIVSVGTEMGWAVHWRVFTVLGASTSTLIGALALSLKSVIKHKGQDAEHKHTQDMADKGLVKTWFGYRRIRGDK